MRIFSSFADVSCSGLLRVRTNFSMTWEVAGEAGSGDFVCLATGPTEIFEFFSMNSVISTGAAPEYSWATVQFRVR
jgi:hypothetical protein